MRVRAMGSMQAAVAELEMNIERKAQTTMKPKSNVWGCVPTRTSTPSASPGASRRWGERGG